MISIFNYTYESIYGANNTDTWILEQGLVIYYILFYVFDIGTGNPNQRPMSCPQGPPNLPCNRPPCPGS